MNLGLTRRTTSADVTCVIMGRLGFSYALIRQRTGLSDAQIGLRLKQTSSQLRRYRNGKSHTARRVLEATVTDTKELMEQIRAELARLRLPPPEAKG